jgi:hypothetical protein
VYTSKHGTARLSRKSLPHPRGKFQGCNHDADD